MKTVIVDLKIKKELCSARVPFTTLRNPEFAIEDIGPSSVLQATGKETKQIHKHIFWSPCVCRTLTLILEDFASGLPWLRDTYKANENTVKYYINEAHILTRFRDHLKLEAPTIGTARFA